MTITIEGDLIPLEIAIWFTVSILGLGYWLTLLVETIRDEHMRRRRQINGLVQTFLHDQITAKLLMVLVFVLKVSAGLGAILHVGRVPILACLVLSSILLMELGRRSIQMRAVIADRAMDGR